jgi:hypothetical protein
VAANNALRNLLLFAFAFCTAFTWISTHTRIWFIHQQVSTFFLLLFLIEGFRQKRAIVMALCVGMSVVSRQLTIFYFLPLAYFLLEKHGVHRLSAWRLEQGNPPNLKPLFKDLLLAGSITLGFISCLLVLNYLKYGDPFESGLNLMYPRPQFSLDYLLKNVRHYFMKPPSLSSDFPFLVYNLRGDSLLFTSPFYFFAIPIRKPATAIVYCLGLTLVIIFGFLLVYASPGGNQFGSRYIIDVLPLIFLLLVFRFDDRNLSPLFVCSVVVSAAFHLLGVIQIREIGC